MEPLSISVGMTLEAAERLLIEKTIESVRGNKKRAAEILGISRSALYAKLARISGTGAQDSATTKPCDAENPPTNASTSDPSTGAPST